MSDSCIRVQCTDSGICYTSTRARLIAAGLAVEDMFPEGNEHWRGNGLLRAENELLWSVQRAGHEEFAVTWGYCAEHETD